MSDEEKILLRRKWEYKNEFKTFGNVIGKMEGFGVLDFTKDDVLILRDNIAELNYTFVGRNLEILSPTSANKVLRMRICELTTNKLVIAISGKSGDEADDRFSREFVELTYELMETV